jgi:hypothetical protein
VRDAGLAGAQLSYNFAITKYNSIAQAAFHATSLTENEG